MSKEVPKAQGKGGFYGDSVAMERPCIDHHMNCQDPGSPLENESEYVEFILEVQRTNSVV